MLLIFNIFKMNIYNVLEQNLKKYKNKLKWKERKYMTLVEQVQQQYYSVMKILIDPELQGLKNRIQILYTNLTEHLESEENHIRKCKMNKGDIEGYAGRIANCNKIIEQENQRADTIKKILEKMESETEQFKKKENEVKDLINRHRMQMGIIENDSKKGLQQIELRQENQENQLKKRYQEQIKIKEELQTKQTSLNTQHHFGLEEIGQIQTTQTNISDRIFSLRERIKEIEERSQREKRNDEQKKEELNRLKIQKDEKIEEKNQLESQITELDGQIAATANQLKKQKKLRDEHQRIKSQLEKQKQRKEKQLQKICEDLERLKQQISLKRGDLHEEEGKLHQLQKEKQKIDSQLKYAKDTEIKIKGQNHQALQDKNQSINRRRIEQEALDKLKSEREKNKASIKEWISKRIQKDKAVKASQNKEKELGELNIEEANKLKKITNEVVSYQVEQQKLSKILQQIKRQQEKYGIQASHAHSKYYQTLEELKIKNTQIQNLQKQNQEVEKKCQHQQNLYEAVRSDRNLYSKDFIKSKQEIHELKKKYKRMTYSVEQLREQIKSKDQQLVQLDKDFKKVESQNTRIQADKNRAKSQIQSTEEVIKNQDNHIGHLKKIIQEVKQQKAKQQKDYDMVRNQRDILGTQLIKRDQQLQQLYEKIKLSNSNLTKGETYFQEKQNEFKKMKIDLTKFRNQFLSIDDQIRCIDDLKAEISFKEKQLLNQKAKVKALEDELQNPMNVHRWRKLEATNQEDYERILKIQTLQRRLISKTQEVEAKQNLIRQKQKLFLELKNILSRQPGAEMHQQLIKYKEALKQKTGHMKKMKGELQNAHEEMLTIKFEVDRLRAQMARMKAEYFELREASEKQVVDDRNFGTQILNIDKQPEKMFEINMKK